MNLLASPASSRFCFSSDPPLSLAPLVSVRNPHLSRVTRCLFLSLARTAYVLKPFQAQPELSPLLPFVFLQLVDSLLQTPSTNVELRMGGGVVFTTTERGQMIKIAR
jgi:hypothetical protein